MLRQHPGTLFLLPDTRKISVAIAEKFKLSKNIKFLTIRRRGKKIVKELENKPKSAWKRVRIPMLDGKGRWLKVLDEKIFLKDYGDELRQIAITGHSKIKPALVITNDFEKLCTELVRKYTRRWLVEKGISEQIEFFHHIYGTISRNANWIYGK
jgi:hypothetical protein